MLLQSKFFKIFLISQFAPTKLVPLSIHIALKGNWGQNDFMI